MRPASRVSAILVTGFVCGACSLLVSLDDLQGGGGACGSDCDGGLDAINGGKDVDVDAPAASDSGPDASTFDPANGCPSGRGSPMVRIGSYCIDVTETTVEQYLAFSDAVGSGDAAVIVPSACSFKSSYAPALDDAEDCLDSTNDRANGSLPIVCVDFCDAFAYCAWAGKRLCGVNGQPALSQSDLADPKLSEWMNACTNGGAETYPYGTDFIEGACNNLQDDGGLPPGAARVNVGTLSQCVGAIGTDDAGRRPFDLSGNVDEWADFCEGDAGPTDLCHWLGDSWAFAAGPVGECVIQDEDVRTAHFHDLGIRCCGTPAP